MKIGPGLVVRPAAHDVKEKGRRHNRSHLGINNGCARQPIYLIIAADVKIVIGIFGLLVKTFCTRVHRQCPMKCMYSPASNRLVVLQEQSGFQNFSEEYDLTRLNNVAGREPVLRVSRQSENDFYDLQAIELGCLESDFYVDSRASAVTPPRWFMFL